MAVRAWFSGRSEAPGTAENWEKSPAVPCRRGTGVGVVAEKKPDVAREIKACLRFKDRGRDRMGKGRAWRLTEATVALGRGEGRAGGGAGCFGARA